MDYLLYIAPDIKVQAIDTKFPKDVSNIVGV